jgi:5'-3' exonuclease
MKNKNLIALVDLDAMLHIIANVQYSAGNRDDADAVRNHARRFIANVCTNATEDKVILMYQKEGHTNFRNDILPEYKGHRTTSDAIALWKPTILEVYADIGAIGLQHIESDDAQSILAEHIGFDRTVIVTSDKDMHQLPAIFYNPYKANLKAEDRWSTMNIYEANRFFWMQVLTGDPTDMPGELCGIEGVGFKTADKMCDVQKPFLEIVKDEYSKKYGDKGFERANRTYKMVRLLKLDNNTYINDKAAEEVNHILSHYGNYIQSIGDKNNNLFGDNPLDLFKM